MPVGQVYLLPQTPQLLFQYAYGLSAAGRWMLAGSLPLNPACKLVLCFSICHTCWYGVSLSAVPAGVMPHYRSYLLMWCLNISPAVLVWCLSIGHAFWCGASLQAMPSGVVPHYQPCLLMCRHTIGHTFWPGASLQPCLLVCCLTIGHTFWCGASSSTMPAGVLPHCRLSLLVWCLIINHAYWCVASL